MRATTLLLASLLAACSSSTTADGGPVDGSTSDGGGTDLGRPDGGGGDAGVGDAGGGDAGGDGGSDAGAPDVVMCTAMPAVWPTFDRSCGTDSDCTIVSHTTSCCGSVAALGIARTDVARFTADEAVCDMQYPACGCFSNAVDTDDGMHTTGDLSAVVVACAAGTCTTSVRAPASCGSATCTERQVCVHECSGIDAGIPLGSSCVDVPPACAASSDCGCFGSRDPCPTGMCVTVSHGAPVCMCA